MNFLPLVYLFPSDQLSFSNTLILCSIIFHSDKNLPVSMYAFIMFDLEYDIGTIFHLICKYALKRKRQATS